MFEELEFDTEITPEECWSFCVAVSCIIGCDREVAEEELEYLEEIAEGLEVDLEEPELSEQVDKALRGEVALEDVLSEVTTPALRRNLFRIMVSTAVADDILKDEEVESLVEGSAVLGLDEEAVMDYLEWCQDLRALESRLGGILERLGP